MSIVLGFVGEISVKDSSSLSRVDTCRSPHVYDVLEVFQLGQACGKRSRHRRGGGVKKKEFGTVSSVQKSISLLQRIFIFFVSRLRLLTGGNAVIGHARLICSARCRGHDQYGVLESR